MRLEIGIRVVEKVARRIVDENDRQWRIVGTKGEVELLNGTGGLCAGRTDGVTIDLTNWTEIQRYLAVEMKRSVKTYRGGDGRAYTVPED